jgi:hypothetical protein
MGFAARYIELRDFAAKNAQTVETTVKSLVRLPRARVELYLGPVSLFSMI